MLTATHTHSGVTSFLKRLQAVNMLAALDYAAFLAVPLNTFASITFRASAYYAGGKPPTRDETAKCRAAVLSVLRSFAKLHNFVATYVWVLERSSGRGLHMHLLCHLPEADHDLLRAELERRFRAVFAWQLAAEVDGHRPIHIADACLDGSNAHRCLNYGQKGIDPSVTQYRRNRGGDPEPQGRIHGKRAGVSRNLDWSARRSAGRGREISTSDLCPKRYVGKLKGRTAKLLREHVERKAAAGGTPAA